VFQKHGGYEEGPDVRPVNRSDGPTARGSQAPHPRPEGRRGEMSRVPFGQNQREVGALCDGERLPELPRNSSEQGHHPGEVNHRHPSGPLPHLPH